MFQYLSLQEGGNLRIIQPTVVATKSRYVIIRYTKGVSDFTVSWVPWFRSVVWDTVTHLPVLVAPPKAMNTEMSTGVRVEEFLEGVTVNCFVDHDGKLVWTTRSSLGAQTGFYGTKTFAEMIQEALTALDVSEANIVAWLGVARSASFVLQHPDHRLIQTVQIPSLTLVQVVSMDSEGHVEMDDMLLDTAPFSRPVVYEPLAEHETALERMQAMSNSKPPSWQGLVFRGSYGERWRVRNISYMILRALLGKEARDEERFARLRKDRQIPLFVQFWADKSGTFQRYETNLRELTRMLNAEYTAVHKLKIRELFEVPAVLRSHVWQLHSRYITDKTPIQLATVIQYVNALPNELIAVLLRSWVLRTA